MRRIGMVRLRQAVGALTVLVCFLSIGAATAPAFASGGSTGPWGGPTPIDPAASGGDGPNAIACVSTGFCIASDDLGNVLTSTDPFAASPSWASTSLGFFLNSVACASASFCVATAGDVVYVSTDPTGGAPEWQSVDVPYPAWAGSISCPTAGFCAVAGNLGNSSYVATSANLTSIAPTWSVSAAFPSGTSAVSCTSTTFCAAVDVDGHALVSTNPTAATPTWTTTTLDGAGEMVGISCESPSLCVAVGSTGAKTLFTSTNPSAQAASWRGFSVGADGGESGGLYGSVSCTASGSCGAVDVYGRAYYSTAPASRSPFWPAAFVERGTAGDALVAISCINQGPCAAVDVNGNLYTAEHPTAVPGPAVAIHLSRRILARGAVLTVRASVTSPAGYVAGVVRFSRGAKLLCRKTYNIQAITGFASCRVPSTKLAVGRNQITVAYLGNVGYAPASAKASVTIRP